MESEGTTSNATKLPNLANLLLKSSNHHLCWFTKCFNSWASRIRNASSPHIALNLYCQMHRQPVPFDSFSILFTIKASAHLHNFSITQHLHSHILKIGFHSHVYVATSLLHSYVLTSIGYACNLFDEMPHRNTITWNTMITGHSKSGNIDRARSVFEEMPSRDVASWSAMIAAYMNNGNYVKGLDLFQAMMVKGLKPDQVTIGSALFGCSHMGNLGFLLGKSIHGIIAKNGWGLNLEIGTIVVDMYAKCGSMRNACKVFDVMPERNVMSWTALICGSAQHGYSKEALRLFERMQIENVKPNEMTFTGILTACAHTGLVEEGRKYFKVIEEFGLERRIQHYGCMVDLFGKSGLLEEAYGVIEKMRIEPNVVVWCSFLSACKEHKKFDMAERVIERVLKMVKPEDDGGVYSLISDLYVLGEKWEDTERVRKLMIKQNVRKIRGSSFIRK